MDREAGEIAGALGAGWGGAQVVLVFGSGLGAAAERLDVGSSVGFEEVPALGSCGVPGHRGRLLRGRWAGVEAVVFQGRRHVYEGLSPAAAALPARLGAALGARLLVTCSAVGAVDPAFAVGSWVFVEDHLNLMGRNPLEGVRGVDGPAFADLSRVYRTDLFERVRAALEGRVERVGRGVLAAFSGPSYETPAEVRMARLLGAAVVGMSTVPEAVWARYLGLDVVAWGCVANPAAGLSPGPIAHQEVVRRSEAGAAEAAVVAEASVKSWCGADANG